jgi:hypothetical protein
MQQYQKHEIHLHYYASVKGWNTFQLQKTTWLSLKTNFELKLSIIDIFFYTRQKSVKFPVKIWMEIS